MLKEVWFGEHRWVFLPLLAAAVLVIVGIIAFAQQRRQVAAVTATTTAEEAEYLFENLNDRLEFLAADLQEAFSSAHPKDQDEHEAMTRHLLEANPFLLAINHINPEGRIDFVFPFDPNKAVIGLHIGIAAPMAALESAVASGVPHLSAPFEIIQGETGYSLMIPHHEGAVIELVFKATSVFGGGSPFRRSTDVMLEIEDNFVVYRAEGYFEQFSQVSVYRSRAEGTVFGRTMTMSAVPSDGLLVKTAGFWEILGVGGLVVALMLMGGVIFLQSRRAAERQWSEAALRESEEKFSLAFHSSPTLMAISTRAEGRFIDVNDTFTAVTGYSREELIGHTGRELGTWANPEDRVRLLQVIDETGRADNLEVHLRNKSGEIRTKLFGAVPIRFGGEECLLTTAIDITERKAAQEALRESEEKYRAIFDEARDGIVLIDSETGLIVDCNQEFERQTGRALADLGKMRIWELRRPDQTEAARQKFLEVQKKGLGESSELSYLRPDGQATPVEFVAKKVEIGGRQYLQSISRDITNRKRMEEQLQQSQLMASLGETTAGIAHEVNNPLSAIILYSELIDTAGLPGGVKTDLRVIRSEAKRASKIMKDLLVYSRKPEPAMRQLDVHRILRKVLTMRRYQEQVGNINVSTNLTPGSLRVAGNASQLTQLFMNLIVNAEEALERSASKTIVVATETDDEWARIFIIDSGSGILEENLSQIFFPFFSTKPTGKGTGLGLSSCHGIVTAHGGLIHAETNDEGGATFTVELPLAKPGAAKGTTKAAMVPSSLEASRR